MGVVARLQNFFRPVQRVFKGTAPYRLTPQVGNPVWHMLDFLAFGREGYEQNALIHAAIKYKVQAIAQTHLRVYRGDPANPEPDLNHPYNQLVRRPNPQQSWREMEGYQEAVLNLAGNAYTYIARPARGGRAERLYPLRPDRVYLIPGEREIRGYLYVPLGATREQGLPLLAEDVMHVKYPNPLDDFEGMGYGLSPMRALAQSGDIDNQATRVLKRNFDQGMLLAGILKFNMPLDPEDMQAARRKWMERYGGSAHAGDIGVLDINAEYQRIAPTFKELGFAEIDERNEARILAPLGVPAILLDTRIAMKSSTYANKAEARKAFWEDTMLYELGSFDAEYTHYLRDGAVFLQRDLSQVPALQKNIPELVSAAKTLWEMGVPVQQAATTVGLPLADVPGGEQGYLPTNVLPVGQVPPRGDKSYSLPVPKTIQATARRSAAEKKALWYQVDGIAQKWATKFGEAAAAALEADKRACIALAQDHAGKARQAKATMDWLKLAPQVARYFRRTAPAQWRDQFTPVMAALVQDAGNFWGVELGYQWNVRNFLAEEWFAQYTLQFAQPIHQTSSDYLQGILAQAQKEGWSIDTMVQRLGQVFDQWQAGNLDPATLAWVEARQPQYRRELIARTETTRLQAEGTRRLFAEWQVERKEWLATPDRRCRPSHSAADGQVRKMAEPFKVGGFDMLGPGDMSLGAPVSEIVLCRCTLLPVVE